MIGTNNEQKRYPLQMVGYKNRDRGAGGGGGAIIWPRLPLKIPYKNLKRKSIEKKLTCFVCGFVLRF